MKQLRSLLALSLFLLTIVIAAPAAFAVVQGIYVGSGQLELLQNGRSQQTFALASSYLTIGGTSDGIKVSFREKNRENATQLTLSGNSLEIYGRMNGLELATDLSSSYVITIDAGIGQLTIRGTPEVYIESSSSIQNLTARNSGAKLAIRNGAYIGQNNLSAIFSGNISRPDSSSTAVYFTLDFNKEGGEHTRLIAYDEESNVLYLEALTPSTTLGQAIKDVSFTVRREYNDNKLSGTWSWDRGYDSATASGSYSYRFTPANSTYDSISVGVSFTNYEDGRRTSSKQTEQYRWDNAQWYGSWDSTAVEEQESRTLFVQIPSDITDKSSVEVYCDGVQTAVIPLSRSDAGSQKRISIRCSPRSVLSASIHY